MPHCSRRALLAAAGSTLLAGCSSERDYATVTPQDITLTDGDGRFGTGGPASERTGRIPPEAAALPDPQYTLELDTTPSWTPVDVLARDTGVSLLANTRTTAGVDAPVRVTVDRTGRVTGRTALSGLPSERLRFVNPTAAGYVVGGYTERPVRTWLRAYRDGERRFEYVTPDGTARQFRSLARFDGDLVAAGTNVGSDVAAVTRFGGDGAVRWTRTDALGAGVDLRAVAGTGRRILAGGARGSTAWLLSLDADGGVVESGALLGNARSYAVRDIAAGATGAYALVGPQSPEAGGTHLVIVALDGDTIRWVRRFDLGRVQSGLGGGAVVDLHGPAVIGHAPAENAAWIALLTPDGTVRRAGYYRFGDDDTRPVGLTGTAEGLLAYGTVSSDHMAERSNVWLSRF